MMRYTIWIILFLLNTTLLSAQTIGEGYLSQPSFAYSDTEGKVHLYNQYYNQEEDLSYFTNPILQHLTFDVAGNMIDSSTISLSNPANGFNLNKGYALNDTVVLIGGVMPKGDPSFWQFHMMQRVNNKTIKDSTIIINLEDGIFNLEGMIINRRGNLVCLFSDANFNPTASYFVKYHFFEINPSTLTVVNDFHLNFDDIEVTSLYEATSMLENTFTNEIIVTNLNFETFVFDATTFRYKAFITYKMDKLFVNSTQNIANDSLNRRVMVTGFYELSESGTVAPGWSNRSREVCIYVINEDLSIADKVYFESNELEIPLAPLATNFDMVDTGHVWIGMGAYEENSFPDRLYSRQIKSTVNVWLTSISGNISCHAQIFDLLDSTNYTPWQVIATQDGGAMVFGTVNLLKPNTLGALTMLFSLKVNNNCEVTQVKEWNVKGNKTLSVYPNPVQSTLHVAIENQGILNGKITTITGKTVKHFTSNNIDVSTLPMGMYTIQVIDKQGEVRVSQFVKE